MVRRVLAAVAALTIALGTPPVAAPAAGASALAAPAAGASALDAAAADAPAAAVPLIAGSPAPGRAAGTSTGGTSTDPSAEQDPNTPPQHTGRAPLMIVLDASGSMNLDDEDSGVRMDDARDTVRDLVDDLPADADVGLVVYGTNTGHNSSEERLGCQDVTVLQELQPLDPENIATAIDEVEPSGYSPIGLALRTAADALPDTGPRNIVLVSDAFDYCTPPDPCEVARQLASGPAGQGLAISTLGVHLDADAQEQLRCIADAGGGQFVDTGADNDSDDGNDNSGTEPTATDRLHNLLTRGYQRGIQRYRAAGTAVAGFPEASDEAPVLVPGDYVDDTFSRGTHYGSGGEKAGTVRYYRLPLGTGMTPWASATIVGDIGSDESLTLGLRIGLVDDDVDACLPAVENTANTGEWDPIPVVTTRVGGTAPGSDTWSADCDVVGPLYLRVERLGDYRSGHELPVEIIVRAEPAADDPGPDAAFEQAPIDPPSPGTPTPAAGGSGYSDARHLEPGRTISDTIVAGETRYYAVHLNWGQRLSYRVKPTGVGTPIEADGSSASVQIRSPFRTEVPAHQQQQGMRFEYRDDPESLTGDTAVPVRYANRTSPDDAVRGVAAAGTYYLLLSLDPTEEGSGRTVPFTLTVDVSGEAGQGPTYRPGAAPDLPTSAGASTADSDTAGGSVAGSNTVGNNTTGGQRTSSDRADQQRQAPAGMPGWLWAGGGAAVALLLAGAAGLFLRRRAKH